MQPVHTDGWESGFYDAAPGEEAQARVRLAFTGIGRSRDSLWSAYLYDEEGNDSGEIFGSALNSLGLREYGGGWHSDLHDAPDEDQWYFKEEPRAVLAGLVSIGILAVAQTGYISLLTAAIGLVTTLLTYSLVYKHIMLHAALRLPDNQNIDKFREDKAELEARCENIVGQTVNVISDEDWVRKTHKNPYAFTLNNGVYIYSRKSRACT